MKSSLSPLSIGRSRRGSSRSLSSYSLKGEPGCVLDARQETCGGGRYDSLLPPQSLKSRCLDSFRRPISKRPLARVAGLGTPDITFRVNIVTAQSSWCHVYASRPCVSFAL